MKKQMGKTPAPAAALPVLLTGCAFGTTAAESAAAEETANLSGEIMVTGST